MALSRRKFTKEFKIAVLWQLDGVFRLRQSRDRTIARLAASTPAALIRLALRVCEKAHPNNVRDRGSVVDGDNNARIAQRIDLRAAVPSA
jgi:hypothetical protein